MGGLYFTFYDPCAKIYSNMFQIATEVGRRFLHLIVPENCASLLICYIKYLLLSIQLNIYKKQFLTLGLG